MNNYRQMKITKKYVGLSIRNTAGNSFEYGLCISSQGQYEHMMEH
jgi:hypothetical protein